MSGAGDDLRKKMHRWRWLRKARASLGGYFWTACPRCGTEFAGYESGYAFDRRTFEILCPACDLETWTPL